MANAYIIEMATKITITQREMGGSIPLSHRYIDLSLRQLGGERDLPQTEDSLPAGKIFESAREVRCLQFFFFTVRGRFSIPFLNGSFKQHLASGPPLA